MIDRTILPALVAFLLVLPACGDDEAEATGAESAACQDLSWRSPTEGAVACPLVGACQ